MDKPKVREMRNAIDKALKEVGEQFGCHVQMNKSITFDNEGFKFGAQITEVGDVKDAAKAAAKKKFKKHAAGFGIDPDAYGKTFESRGTAFKIDGIKPKARKYPVLATNDNGTRYKFPASVAERAQ